jgi:hypothetical protein
MSKYYKVDPEIWENGWYSEEENEIVNTKNGIYAKIRDAFPNIQKDKVYQCFSLLWVETPNQLLRVVDDLGGSSYIPSEFMIPIDILRDKIIDEIINND